MRSYWVTMRSRHEGAIGMFYPHRFTVKAENAEQAVTIAIEQATATGWETAGRLAVSVAAS